jgi:hypothetical protein
MTIDTVPPESDLPDTALDSLAEELFAALDAEENPEPGGLIGRSQASIV